VPCASLRYHSAQLAVTKLENKRQKVPTDARTSEHLPPIHFGDRHVLAIRAPDFPVVAAGGGAASRRRRRSAAAETPALSAVALSSLAC